MHKTLLRVALFAALFSPVSFLLPAVASASTVYNAIPASLAPNYPSQAFQAAQARELGDYVHLSGTDRLLTTVSVTMDNWALKATPANVTFCAANASNCDTTGFFWPITVNIYSNHLGANNVPDTLLATKTVTQHIPWRGAEDSTNCPTKDNPGYAYKYQTTLGAPDTNCFNGIAANITFDLSSLNVTLPNDVIVSFGYNTETYGPAPAGVDGPYNSLNIALPPSNVALTGSDDNADQVFFNSLTAGQYGDLGVGGVGIFRKDTGWTPYGTMPIQINAVSPINTTVVVHQTDLETTLANAVSSGKWYFYDDTADALNNVLGSFVTGPGTAPLGTGSAEVTLAGATSRVFLTTSKYGGKLLSTLSAFSFSEYSHSGSGVSATEVPFVRFNVDFTGSNAFQGSLVYEPTDNGAITQDGWQTWNMINGGNAKWQYTNHIWPTTATGPDAGVVGQSGNVARTLSAIIADYPSIQMLASGPQVGVRIGEPGPAGYIADTDAFTIGFGNTSTTYDFEPAVVVPPAAPQVHIFKFVDGVQATALNANSAVFPMNASWVSSTLGTVPSVGFTLSSTGWGATDAPYEASYVGGAAGDNYATNEVTGGAVVGASCTDGKPFALVGYGKGDTLQAAVASATSTASPSFTNLQSDKYVVVWNKTCAALPPPGTGSISGIKFEDWDADGSPYESKWEVKLAGWTIYLDTNDNGVLDSGETSTTTDSHGAYKFINLPAGTYHVREVQKSGWVGITPVSGKYNVTLTVDQAVKGKDFGNFKLGSISGMKFNDLNGNHKKDAGELGLQGWTINLTGPNGYASTTVTDINGNYSFTGLMQGKYKLAEVMKPGWKQTVHPGTVKINSDTNATKENFGNKLKVTGNSKVDKDDGQDQEDN